MIRGQFPTPLDGRHGPITNPAVDPAIPHFTHSSHICARYYGDPVELAKIVPDCFEMEDRPIVSVRFYNYGMSRLGPYRENMFFIQVYYNGKKYDYCPYLYVTNEAALIAGREPLGFPKLIGRLDFDPYQQDGSPLVRAHLYRPDEVPLMYGVFRPMKYAGKVQDHPELCEQLPAIAVRTLPATKDSTPIAELVAAQMNLIEGDIWPCKGQFKFTGYSDIDDLEKMYCVEPIDAYLYTDCTFTLALGSAEKFSLNK